MLRDDGDGLVAWIGPRSAVIRRLTVSGESVRDRRLADKLDIPTVPAVTEWIGPGVVIVTPPDAWHAIWWFFHETGEFRSWYVNLQTPIRRWWGGVDMRDHALDVVVAADRSWRWKDEDEFDERTGHPLYWTADEAATDPGGGRTADRGGREPVATCSTADGATSGRTRTGSRHSCPGGGISCRRVSPGRASQARGQVGYFSDEVAACCGCRGRDAHRRDRR